MTLKPECQLIWISGYRTCLNLIYNQMDFSPEKRLAITKVIIEL